MTLSKYVYEFIVQGNYGAHGWEDLTAHETRKDARVTLREYNENETQYPHRIIYRRTLRGESE